MEVQSFGTVEESKQTVEVPKTPSTDLPANDNVWKKPVPSPEVLESQAGGNKPGAHPMVAIESKNEVESKNEELPLPCHQDQVRKESEAPSPEPDKRPSTPDGPKSILVQDDELCLKINDLSMEVIRNFQSTVQDITSYQTTLLQDMKDAQQQKEKSELKCRQIQEQIKEIELEQNRLAEQEEFEQADILSGQLHSLQEEYSEYVELDKESILKYEEAELSLKNCRQELSNKMNETSHGLRNLIRQQTEELDKLVTANSKALSDENNRVSLEEERINMEMEHVKREETTINDETDVIEKAILSQTCDAQKDKEDMERELMGVNSEVERLAAELALKQQEQKMLEMNLLVAEGKIREVRKKFDRQLQRIADRSMTIRAAREECHMDEEAIQAERVHYASEKEKLNVMEKRIADQIQQMEREKDVAENLKTTFDEVLMDISNKKPSSDDEDTARLRESVVAQETQLEKAIAALEATRASITTLNEEEDDIKDKIPALETEKKAHASNKRFKEAANVARDIKALTARKEEIANLIADHESHICDKELAIEKGREQLAVALAELTAAERVSDLARFDILVEQIKSLRLACRKSEVAYEATGSHNLIAKVAFDLLSAELQVLLNEASEIKEKHKLEADLLPPLNEGVDNASDKDNCDDSHDSEREGDGQEECQENISEDGHSDDGNATPEDKSEDDGDVHSTDDSSPHDKPESDKDVVELISKGQVLFLLYFNSLLFCQRLLYVHAHIMAGIVAIYKIAGS